MVHATARYDWVRVAAAEGAGRLLAKHYYILRFARLIYAGRVNKRRKNGERSTAAQMRFNANWHVWNVSKIQWTMAAGLKLFSCEQIFYKRFHCATLPCIFLIFIIIIIYTFNAFGAVQHKCFYFLFFLFIPTIILHAWWDSTVNSIIIFARRWITPYNL